MPKINIKQIDFLLNEVTSFKKIKLNEVYTIFKISCIDANITDFYIGMTTNLKNLKNTYRAGCNNPNDECYNSKLCKAIRDNGNWENWKVTIISTCTFPTDELNSAKKRLKQVIDDLKPTLNMCTIYTNEEERKEGRRKTSNASFLKNKEAIYKKHNEKIKCHCGGHYTKQQRVRHFKTATHILNDPVYTKHRLENLMAYQHIEYAARKHPQIAEHQIIKCCCGGHYRHRFREVHLRTNEHLNFVNNAQNV